MPIYEYRCRACGERLERLRKLSDPPLTLCPECGEDALERLLSAPAFQFKGSGWYVTDYAGKGREKDGGKTEKDGGTTDKDGGKAEKDGPGKKEKAAEGSSGEAKTKAASGD